MTNAFHKYIATQLLRDIQKRTVVVFYDPRREFEGFIDELRPLEPPEGQGGIPRVWVEDKQTHLLRFEGSYFALKASAEPILSLDKPEPLLVYLPGEERDRQGSVLMEMEKAGTTYEPQLRRLARNVLRRWFTDGDIDQMLAADNLTYHDVVAYMEQGGDGQGSVVQLVVSEKDSERILIRWLADPELDARLEARQAIPELYRLVQARLGFALEADTPLAKARRQTLRFVLVNEFRQDLRCTPPANLDLVPAPDAREERERITTVAAGLRKEHADAYVAMADELEAELGLGTVGLDPAALGTIDTFRFEERALLAHTAELIADAHYARALEIIAARGRSFWVDRDLERFAQWEAARLMAELGQQVTRVRPLLQRANSSARKWVESYAADWFEVDRAQRALEAFIAKMQEEPEEALEKALGRVRRHHEALIAEMAKGYTKALMASGWTVPGVLHQTRIHPEVVDVTGDRTAYFFVDAMRYEMGADLVEQLSDGEAVTLAPAVSVLPSITVLGMAALLPGASASYSVVEHKGSLAARIDDRVLTDHQDRQKYLQARYPGVKDLDLGTLLQRRTRRLEKELAGNKLLIVRSQSIDGLGEMDGGLLARQIMDTIIGNIARAVRKLARVGYEHFVITADHGHQFAVRKDEDMLMDRPGGDTVDQHRRCWAGRGGQTPAACLRVGGANLGYDTDLDFIFPRGLALFRTGGDLAFHHGGISLQEMVIPVVSLRMPAKGAEQPVRGSKVQLDNLPKVLTNRTFGMRVVVGADLFSQDPVRVRLVLVADGQVVGQAGMAVDSEFDRASGTVTLLPGRTASIGMMLMRDDVAEFRVVAQEPDTDAVLAQSNEIAVKLGM
ncbi:MAG: PglZ domain-containing protein [Deltaproteobacteria bacterium]|nr:MAG: PglZ domain-containing protein [Deltaproteobacteria bacterium]